MRPMPNAGPDNVTGAFVPHPNIGKFVDSARREVPFEVGQYDSQGAVPYGTFIDINGPLSKYGTASFYKTDPRAAFPLTATLKGYSSQVQNPASQIIMPGYANDLFVMDTPLSQLINKPNFGSAT